MAAMPFPGRCLLLGLLFAIPVLRAAETPSPALLVVNKEDATLAIVDPASRQVVARIPVGQGPHEVVTSADGKLAIVSNYGERAAGKTLSVIDLRTQKELRRVQLSPLQHPHGLYFADGKVYFTAEDNMIIGRYDPASDEVEWMLGTGQRITHMIQLSRDRNTIFTANIGSNSVSIIAKIPFGRGWDPTVVPVGKGPEGFDLSPDGKQLWVAHSQDGGISIIDLASKRVVQSFDIHTKRSNRLRFTTDGGRVLVSDLEGGELVVIDAGTRSVLKRIAAGKAPGGILIEPGGSRAYVAVSGDNQVAVLNVLTWEVTDRFSTGMGPDGMAWAVR